MSDQEKPKTEKKYAKDPLWRQCSNERCHIWRQEPQVKAGDKCPRCGRGTFK